MHDGAIIRRVAVPIGGPTIRDHRARASALGLDPDSREARLVTVEETEPDWQAVVSFEVGSSGAVPISVAIESNRGQPVTRAVWDRVRVAEVIREAAETVAWLGPVVFKPDMITPIAVDDRPRGRGRGRPATYSDAHYRRVADIYSNAGKRPVRAVAAAFASDFPGITGSTDRRARSWVREARRRGYISEREDASR